LLDRLGLSFLARVGAVELEDGFGDIEHILDVGLVTGDAPCVLRLESAWDLNHLEQQAVLAD